MPRSSSDGGRRRKAGAKDLHERLTKDELIKRLKAFSEELQEAQQEVDEEKYSGLAASLGSPFILKHKDKEVCAHAASCLTQIFRIYVPQPVYDRKQLKDIFTLLTNQLYGLARPDKSGSTDRQHQIKRRNFAMLEGLATVKSFTLCLEFDLEEHIIKLFKIFFSVVNENHSLKEKNLMLETMAPLVLENDAVSQQLLDVILTNLLEPQKSQNPSAYSLASSLLKRCAANIGPYIQAFINSVLAGSETKSELDKDVFKLIQELNKVASSLLLSVLPQLELKIKSTDVEERMSVIKLLGNLFAHEDSNLIAEHRSLWNSYLGRFVDVNVDVRVECVTQAQRFLVTQPASVPDISDKLDERQRDPEERVRQQVVTTICGAAAANISCVSDKLFDDVCERLWDKKVSVRKEALTCLGELYRKVTTGQTLNVKAAKRLSWIPNKIIRCYYHKDFENRMMVERVLPRCLIPSTLDPKQKMRRLLSMFSSLEDKTAEAFQYILKVQLSLRADFTRLVELADEDISEANEKEIFSTILKLARTVPDHYKAQEHLKKLRQLLKEPRMKEALRTSVDPTVGCAAVHKAQSEVLTKLGSKNPIYETVSLLLDRASPSLMDQACAKILVGLVHEDLEGLGDLDDDEMFESPGSSDEGGEGTRGMFLLLALASVFPSQFQNDDCFEQILVFLRNSDSRIVEYALQTLAHVAGGLEKCSDSLLPCYQPVISKLATRGNPRQAKHAVRSIVKIFTNTTAVLERVVASSLDCLSFDNPLLLAALTSLGEVAFLVPSVFEENARSTAYEFVMEDLLPKDRASAKAKDGKNEWCDDCDVSRETQAKVIGIKLLVKWVKGSPKNDKALATPVIQILHKILKHLGDLQQQGAAPPTDRARLRLAAAYGLLKIAGESYYRELIALPTFQELALVMQDSCYEVRDKFTKKLHKALDQSMLPLNYFAIFALAATEPSKERKSQVKQMIAKNVTNKREYIKQHSYAQAHAHRILPEYALPCVIHLLAHHPDFDRKEVETLNQFKEYLWFFMEPIMVKAENYSFLKKLVETVKQAKDAQDPDNEEANHAMYTLCDLALGLLSYKVQSFVLKDFPGSPTLPKKMFLPGKLKNPNTTSHLPKGFFFAKKKAPAAEAKSTPVKSAAKSSSAKATGSASKRKPTTDKKEPRRTTPRKTRKTFKEMVNEEDSPHEEPSDDEDTGDSGFVQESPRKRTTGSPDKTASKRTKAASDDGSARKKGKTGTSKTETPKKKATAKPAQSPLKSLAKRSPFASPEELITKKPTPSPRRGKATRKLESELDSVPEDLPDGSMSDASTSGYKSSKKPLSSKGKATLNGVSRSNDEGNKKKTANAKRKNDGSNAGSSPSKKKKTMPEVSEQPQITVKMRGKRRR